ncbi:hypothetical protein [Streptomyces sp. NPDC007206]
MNLLLIKPEMYWALTQARTTHWGTRKVAESKDAVPAGRRRPWWSS